MGACPGWCCAALHLSNEHLGWLANEPENVRDGAFIVDMLVELTFDEVRDIHRGLMGWDGWKPEPGERYWTCRHWDGGTGLCTVYEKRPQMCRDYAETILCHHGCGRCG